MLMTNYFHFRPNSKATPTTSTASPWPSTSCSASSSTSAATTTSRTDSRSSSPSPLQASFGSLTIRPKKTWRTANRSTSCWTSSSRSPPSCRWTCWSRASPTRCWETLTISFTSRVVLRFSKQLKSKKIEGKIVPWKVLKRRKRNSYKIKWKNGSFEIKWQFWTEDNELSFLNEIKNNSIWNHFR